MVAMNHEYPCKSLQKKECEIIIFSRCLQCPLPCPFGPLDLITAVVTCFMHIVSSLPESQGICLTTNSFLCSQNKLPSPRRSSAPGSLLKPGNKTCWITALAFGPLLKKLSSMHYVVLQKVPRAIKYHLSTVVASL